MAPEDVLCSVVIRRRSEVNGISPTRGSCVFSSPGFNPILSAATTSAPSVGSPSIRHPAYGVHICLTVGLPEEVAHAAGAHSGEGELVTRSLENTIIHFADYAFWRVLDAGGLLDHADTPEKA